MNHEPFRGQFDVKVDSKGRIFLPSKFRAAFADGGAIACRRDKVALYTKVDNDENADLLYERMRQGEIPRDLFDVLIGRSYDFTVDTQGRISLPKNIREEYALEGPLALLGTYECLSLMPIAQSPAENADVISRANDLAFELGL